MKQKIESLITEALTSLGIEADGFVVEHPTDLKMGDYSTNVAIKHGAKKEEIFGFIQKHFPEGIERVEMVGPGFINFYLSQKFFKESLKEIMEKGESFGRGEHAKGFKVMVEHTDPNPFKEFHIGHLMPNVIGSTLARIFEWNGAEVKQVNYQGDVGLHVAKALWAGGDYAKGNQAYEEDAQAKVQIEELNKKIYDKSDSEVNDRYQKGKKESLEKFEEIYKKLGTKFDHYFFESETGEVGKKIVLDNVPQVFEESEGAIVYKGSHTRVFINSKGLPTYEAKDLGNAKIKAEWWPYDLSVVVTGNEIRDYFKVVLEAMEKVLPELAKKTKHLPHGMLRLPSGKMSSRTGNVIIAQDLIEEVREKVKDDEQVAMGAIKYMILRQSIGNDIIFDIDKSVSVEGDSGVYLQYAHARASSLLEKAGKPGNIEGETGVVREIEKMLYRFPEVVERAGQEYSPNYITTYLTELASAFNNFYAHEQVLEDSSEALYRLAIVEAFKMVMKNGLSILGIPAPERM